MANGTRLFIADDFNPVRWKDLGKECLRIYEPSPILKMISRDIEEAKASMRIPMSITFDQSGNGNDLKEPG